MTDDKQTDDKGNVDVTTKSGIHISLPGALLISVIMGAATLVGHCSTNNASAVTPDISSKIDKIASDVSDLKNDTKSLATKVDALHDDVQILKVEQANKK